MAVAQGDLEADGRTGAQFDNEAPRQIQLLDERRGVVGAAHS
jgi:hypothetical protein